MMALSSTNGLAMQFLKSNNFSNPLYFYTGDFFFVILHKASAPATVTAAGIFVKMAGSTKFGTKVCAF
jgi:hypothetical protein